MNEKWKEIRHSLFPRFERIKKRNIDQWAQRHVDAQIHGPNSLVSEGRIESAYQQIATKLEADLLRGFHFHTVAKRKHNLGEDLEPDYFKKLADSVLIVNAVEESKQEIIGNISSRFSILRYQEGSKNAQEVEQLATQRWNDLVRAHTAPAHAWELLRAGKL